MDTFETFYADLKEEAIRRNLFDGKTADVKSWSDHMKWEYINHHYYDMWDDEDRVYEKILAIRELLKDEIGVETITMTLFLEHLEKTTNFYLKSLPWLLDACQFTIRIVLDTFQRCYD